MQDAEHQGNSTTQKDTATASEHSLAPGMVLLATVQQATREDGLTAIAPLHIADSSGILATSTQQFSAADVGKQVACVQPLGASHFMIMGVVMTAPGVQNPLLDELLTPTAEPEQPPETLPAESVADEVSLNLDEVSSAELRHQDAQLMDYEEQDSDPETLVLRARQAVIIKCGESSISLGADGRIRLNGRNIFSRASHLQRIAGGAIKLN